MPESRSVSEPLLNCTIAGEENVDLTPFQRASFFSKATFFWMTPMLLKGKSRPLQLNDVPLIPPEDQAETALKSFIEAWESQKRNGQLRKQSILRALVSCYWKDVLHTGILAFFKASATVSGPIFIYFFVDYASGNNYFQYEGIVLVISLMIVKIIENYSQRHWYFGVRRLGIKVQSALTAAVYQKELCLSNLGRRKHATGEIVNYISVDIYRLSEFLWWMHWAWNVPYQILVAVALLFLIVKWAALPGLILTIFFILVLTPLISSMQKCQGEFMVSQDERLRATTEVLNGMKVIKLQAWEERFKTFIDGMRDLEFKWLAGTQRRRNYATVLYWLMPTVVTAVVLVTCIFLNVTLTATIVFTVLATFRTIQDPIRSVPDLLSSITQAYVSVRRLDIFLREDELPKPAVRTQANRAIEYAIRIDSAVLSWNPDQDVKPTLKNINMVVKRGEKVAVCGAIGCGKSTLLLSILGEIPRVSGSVQFAGKIAYLPQTAWIQTGTVRENILFGLPMNEIRYRNTLRACALEQDLQSFSHGDLTEIGERGVNMSGGQKQRIQLARAVYNDADIYLLDDPFSAVDAQTAATLFHDCVLGALSKKTVVLVTHQVEFLTAVDNILVMQDGEIIQAGTYKQLLTASKAFQQLVSAHEDALHTVSHGNGNGTIHDVCDNHIISFQRKPSNEETRTKTDNSSNAPQLIQEEEKEIGDMGMKPYIDYVKVSGSAIVVAGMVIGQILYAITQLASNIWLALEISNVDVTSGVLVAVYVALSFASAVFFFHRSTLVVKLGLKASKSFFNGLMSSVMKAPMGFFDSTPCGRILNRASIDMSVLDLDIPFTFGYIMALIFDLIGIVIATAVATWEILILAIPILLLIQYLQKFYMATSRELARMNSTTKAPILNNSAETISGAMTIRAFQMVERFRRKNLMLIDNDASMTFHKFAAVEWLMIQIEFSCAIVTCFTALVVVLRSNVSPGVAGLAITYALALNNSQVYLSWWQCMFANYIVSVERVKQYMDLPMEAPAIIETNRPPRFWPNKGTVVLNNLQIRYRENSPLVLRGITCTFYGGQKIGVVGRTGSGKTTLISAIFRLVEPSGGSIFIDNIDICSIGLHDVRFRLGIIPQEPVLFRGTVRTNLDPLNQYSDFEIWETIHKCQLGNLIKLLPLQLESPVTDQGENWSAGQRQLFCLGRVLLKRSQVLVLDEATASIDSATDALLQKVIREEFCACTVITVAHRIPTVIDSDMVLALQDGLLMEFARPSELMERKNSLFAKLVAEYWAQMGGQSKDKIDIIT